MVESTIEINNLIELLENRVRQKQNARFITEIKTGKELSYIEFYQMICERKDFFEKSGMKRKDRVGLMLNNSIDFIVDFFSILYIEAIVIPINPSFKDRELKYILTDANIRFLIQSKEKEADYDFGKIKNTWHINSDTRLVELYDNIQKDSREDNLEENTALILHTSGSTGNAKGVMLNHKNLLKEMANIRNAHELTDKDKVLCVLPWFHINGLVITMLTPLLVGHEMVIAEKFSQSRFWQWIEQYKITWFSGVPTIYTYLLAGNETPKANTLRFARSASASLPVQVLKAFESRYNVKIIESYGMTEGGSQLTSNPLPPKATKAGSVGIPYGLEIRIVNDTGMKCEPFETGEVQFRGDSITHGYYKKKQETIEAFDDGWLKTGDIGYLDEDGYLFLSGRKKELINRSGEKFSPREIDEVLYQFPGIKLAAAIGVPDSVHGEDVVAFCVGKEDTILNVEQIKEFCKKNLVDYKVPKEIYLLDDFPLGGNGKIQRLKLKEVYENMEKKK